MTPWLNRLIDAELEAADADHRARLDEIDTYGYGRPPSYRPGTIIGLCTTGLCAAPPMITHQPRVPSMGGKT